MTKTPHSLQCDGPNLPKGARQERAWSCTCGEQFFGYDADVRRSFSAHKAGA